MTAYNLINEIFDLSDENRAEGKRRFFKTGKGEYGENDKFIGVSMPALREVVKNKHAIELSEIEILLESEFHEIRMAGLLILVQKFQKRKLYNQDQIVEFYLQNLSAANNWDLVDSTAYHILGEYLILKDKKILFELAASENLWFRRVAVVATLTFIKKGHYDTTFELVNVLKNHPEDILQKALGWALREIIKKGGKTECLKFIYIQKTTLPQKIVSIAIQDLSPAEKVQIRNY